MSSTREHLISVLTDSQAKKYAAGGSNHLYFDSLVRTQNANTLQYLNQAYITKTLTSIRLGENYNINDSNVDDVLNINSYEIIILGKIELSVAKLITFIKTLINKKITLDTSKSTHSLLKLLLENSKELNDAAFGPASEYLKYYTDKLRSDCMVANDLYGISDNSEILEMFKVCEEPDKTYEIYNSLMLCFLKREGMVNINTINPKHGYGNTIITLDISSNVLNLITRSDMDTDKKCKITKEFVKFLGKKIKPDEHYVKFLHEAKNVETNNDETIKAWFAFVDDKDFSRDTVVVDCHIIINNNYLENMYSPEEYRKKFPTLFKQDEEGSKNEVSSALQDVYGFMDLYSGDRGTSFANYKKALKANAEFITKVTSDYKKMCDVLANEASDMCASIMAESGVEEKYPDKWLKISPTRRLALLSFTVPCSELFTNKEIKDFFVDNTTGVLKIGAEAATIKEAMLDKYPNIKSLVSETCGLVFEDLKSFRGIGFSAFNVEVDKMPPSEFTDLMLSVRGNISVLNAFFQRSTSSNASSKFSSPLKNMLQVRYNYSYNEMYSEAEPVDGEHSESIILQKIKSKPTLLSTTGWSLQIKTFGCIEIVPSQFSIISNEFVKSIMSEALYTSDPLSLLNPGDTVRAFGGAGDYYDPLGGAPPDKLEEKLKYSKVEAYFAKPIFSTTLDKNSYSEYIQDYNYKKSLMTSVRGLPYNVHLSRLVHKRLEVVKDNIYDAVLQKTCSTKMGLVPNYNLMNDVSVQLLIPTSCKMEKDAANMLVLFSQYFKDMSYSELADRAKLIYGSADSLVADAKVKGSIIRDRIKKVGLLVTMTGQSKPSDTSKWQSDIQHMSWGEFNLGQTQHKLILGRTPDGIPIAAPINEYAGCLKGYDKICYPFHTKYKTIEDEPYKDEMIELTKEFYCDYLYEPGVGEKKGYDPCETSIHRRINTPNILINIIGVAGINGKIKKVSMS